MILWRTAIFETDYAGLPEKIAESVKKALRLFAENPRHPSLQVKKMKGLKGVWEGRVSRGYRFTFSWTGEIVILRRVGTHDILEKEARRR